MKSKFYHFLDETGQISVFTGRFFAQAFRRPFEWKELLHQCYLIGYHSIFLVAATGFIMGLVLTLQLRPTMIEFGAVSYMPNMVSIAFDIVKMYTLLQKKKLKNRQNAALKIASRQTR